MSTENIVKKNSTPGKRNDIKKSYVCEGINFTGKVEKQMKYERFHSVHAANHQIPRRNRHHLQIN